MKICIVGGGHIGTTLACYIKHFNQYTRVSLFTQHQNNFSNIIKCNDVEQQISYFEQIDCISNDPSLAAKDADIVFIALPHFAVEQAFKNISPHVAKKSFVGVLPGGGGCEFFFNKYFSSDQTLFGFQRVPFTAKLVKYGNETNLKSWKPFSVVGTQKKGRIDQACDLIERCGLKTKKAANYLSISLTPTNPILHTSRTFDLFGNFERNHVFDEKFKFYVGWTNNASETLFAMDRELHHLLDKIPEIDTSAIRPLSEHYESPTIESLTRKINSIQTFQSVYAPLVPSADRKGYVSDTSSRMFTEDFPWGLAIFRSYCDVVGTKSPVMDRVLNWYADYMNLEWYHDGKFTGKDLFQTGILGRYGVTTKQELLAYYE